MISSLFSHFYALCNKLWRFSQFFNFTFVHFNDAIWIIVIDLLQRSWQTNQKAAKMHCVFWGIYETRLCCMWKMYINISFVYDYVMWNYKKYQTDLFIKRFRIIIVEKRAVTYDIVKILSWYKDMIGIWSEKLEYSVFAKIFLKRLSIFRRFLLCKITRYRENVFISDNIFVGVVWYDSLERFLKKGRKGVDKRAVLVYNI